MNTLTLRYYLAGIGILQYGLLRLHDLCRLRSSPKLLARVEAVVRLLASAVLLGARALLMLLLLEADGRSTVWDLDWLL